MISTSQVLSLRIDVRHQLPSAKLGLAGVHLKFTSGPLAVPAFPVPGGPCRPAAGVDSSWAVRSHWHWQRRSSLGHWPCTDGLMPAKKGTLLPPFATAESRTKKPGQVRFTGFRALRKLNPLKSN
jgi:hypothetical protein